jgi:cbb3-type cytochrome oxidase subunit 1
VQNRIAIRFIRHAAIYGLIGMIWGIYMAASEDHTTHVGHAHLMLIGWVSLALFGLAYQTWPKAAEGIVPVIQFWVANLGIVLIAPGLWLIYTGNVAVGEPLATIGSILTILSMVLFIVALWRGTTR